MLLVANACSISEDGITRSDSERPPSAQMMVIEAEHFEFLGDIVTEANVNGEFAVQVCM